MLADVGVSAPVSRCSLLVSGVWAKAMARSSRAINCVKD